MIGVVVLMGFAMITMYAFFEFVAAQAEPGKVRSESLQAVQERQMGPSLDPDDQISIEELRAQQERLLSEYEWLAGKRAYARIPLQRAREMMAKTHASPSKAKLP